MQATDYAIYAEPEVDSIKVAVEFLDYKRGEGFSLGQIVAWVEAGCRENNWPVGRPDAMTPDDVVYWLAMIWTGYLAR